MGRTGGRVFGGSGRRTGGRVCGGEDRRKNEFAKDFARFRKAQFTNEGASLKYKFLPLNVMMEIAEKWEASPRRTARRPSGARFRRSW